MVEELLDPIVNEADLESIGTDLEQFKKDSQFLDANRAEWRVAYPDKWVVVFQETLVGVGDTAREALLQAQEHDVTLYRVAIEYLASKPLKMVLFGEKT